jgi:hypothetical protein
MFDKYKYKNLNVIKQLISWINYFTSNTDASVLKTPTNQTNIRKLDGNKFSIKKAFNSIQNIFDVDIKNINEKINDPNLDENIRKKAETRYSVSIPTLKKLLVNITSIDEFILRVYDLEDNINIIKQQLSID